MSLVWEALRTRIILPELWGDGGKEDFSSSGWGNIKLSQIFNTRSGGKIKMPEDWELEEEMDYQREYMDTCWKLGQGMSEDVAEEVLYPELLWI